MPPSLPPNFLFLQSLLEPSPSPPAGSGFVDTKLKKEAFAGLPPGTSPGEVPAHIANVCRECAAFLGPQASQRAPESYYVSMCGLLRTPGLGPRHKPPGMHWQRAPDSRFALGPALPGTPPVAPAFSPAGCRGRPAPPGVSAGGEIPCRLAAGAKGARRTAVCRERPAPPGVPNFSLNFSLNFGLNFNLKFSLNFSLNFSGISRLV